MDITYTAICWRDASGSLVLLDYTTSTWYWPTHLTDKPAWVDIIVYNNRREIWAPLLTIHAIICIGGKIVDRKSNIPLTYWRDPLPTPAERGDIFGPFLAGLIAEYPDHAELKCAAAAVNNAVHEQRIIAGLWRMLHSQPAGWPTPGPSPGSLQSLF